MKAILLWDQHPEHLASFIPQVTLISHQVVNLYRGQFIYPGTLKVFFGYRLANGVVVANPQALDITIQTGCGSDSRSYASNLPSGSTLTSETTAGQAVSQVIAIENTGEEVLQLTGYSLSNTRDFQVTPADLSMSLKKGGIGNVTVRCHYSGENLQTAELGGQDAVPYVGDGHTTSTACCPPSMILNKIARIKR